MELHRPRQAVLLLSGAALHATHSVDLYSVYWTLLKSFFFSIWWIYHLLFMLESRTDWSMSHLSGTINSYWFSALTYLRNPPIEYSWSNFNERKYCGFDCVRILDVIPKKLAPIARANARALYNINLLKSNAPDICDFLCRFIGGGSDIFGPKLLFSKIRRSSFESFVSLLSRSDY